MAGEFNPGSGWIYGDVPNKADPNKYERWERQSYSPPDDTWYDTGEWWHRKLPNTEELPTEPWTIIWAQFDPDSESIKIPLWLNTWGEWRTLGNQQRWTRFELQTKIFDFEVKSKPVDNA